MLLRFFGLTKYADTSLENDFGDANSTVSDGFNNADKKIKLGLGKLHLENDGGGILGKCLHVDFHAVFVLQSKGFLNYILYAREHPCIHGSAEEDLRLL